MKKVMIGVAVALLLISFTQNALATSLELSNFAVSPFEAQKGTLVNASITVRNADKVERSVVVEFYDYSTITPAYTTGAISIPPGETAVFEGTWKTNYNPPHTYIAAAINASGNASGAATIYYTEPGGGCATILPIDKLLLFAPYIGLASTLIVATFATTAHAKQDRQRKNKQQTSSAELTRHMPQKAGVVGIDQERRLGTKATLLTILISAFYLAQKV